MNLSRLMMLSVLAGQGPRHGHQLRRDAERANAGNWAGVKMGALYRELNTMEQAGQVVALRREQLGLRPARTVYEITDEGRKELQRLRDQAIRGVHFGADPLGVALMFGRVADRAEVADMLADRRELITLSLKGLRDECARLREEGQIDALDVAMFHRRELQLEAELSWHDEFESLLIVLPETAGS